MKVLKPGRLQLGWAQDLSCSVAGGCGAVLLVEQSDLFYRPCSDDYDAGLLFDCICCGMRNKLDKKTAETVPQWHKLRTESTVNFMKLAEEP